MSEGPKASPLSGRRIVVTRPRSQARELLDRLAGRGAVCLFAPAIRLAAAPARTMDRAIDRLAAGEFRWIVFTSRAGVDALRARIEARGSGVGEVQASVAAVGEGTADALRGWGLEPDLVPKAFTTEALGRAMPRGSGAVLLARADIAPAGLESALGAKGWTPVRLNAYRTRLPRAMPASVRAALERDDVDAITFTSASTVAGFMGMAGPLAGRIRARDASGRPRVVCIGPVTARAAGEAGLTVDGVARPHTIEGLVAALERVFDRVAPSPVPKES